MLSTKMRKRLHPRDLAGPVLRSITPATGALAAGLGVIVPILAAVYYEVKFGRPSSTAGLAIPFAFIWGSLAAAVGAALGAGIRQTVAGTRWAGPMDRRVAAVLVTIAITVPSVLAVQAARRLEAENAPRVIRSTGEILRAEGMSELSLEQSASFLWSLSSNPDHPREELRWNGQRVDVRVADDQLRLSAGELPIAEIDISRFDYARAAYGVTATLSGDGEESLALILELRATSHRDLLLIFDPDGALLHEELLERYSGRFFRAGLGTAGPATGPQEIVLDRGVPIRYYVSAR